ncbi:unnamed protein product [Paramecium octaurelia]|uniref:Uncharacterized protein n=1 Tax=Paramecium octaurelia TaxID=43137 RepID=A0A8S1TAY1_PAROT|nr:unnamed protein product [Paramecium octaurelia]
MIAKANIMQFGANAKPCSDEDTMILPFVSVKQTSSPLKFSIDIIAQPLLYQFKLLHFQLQGIM